MTKPKVYVATPCYDSMRVETCVSLIDMFSTLGKHGIECTFKTMRTCYITHARNMLTCAFLNSNYDYLLFVDADVEFSPEAVLRMLVPKMDIVCTPYRVKNKPEIGMSAFMSSWNKFTVFPLKWYKYGDFSVLDRNVVISYEELGIFDRP